MGWDERLTRGSGVHGRGYVWEVAGRVGACLNSGSAEKHEKGEKKAWCRSGDKDTELWVVSRGEQVGTVALSVLSLGWPNILRLPDIVPEKRNTGQTLKLLMKRMVPVDRNLQSCCQS